MPVRAWLVPVAIAAVPAAVALLVEPPTRDLAAATFRAELFGREGVGAWNGTWYGGHHTPGYSLLYPPLGWLLGPIGAGALAAVAAAGLFGALAHLRLGRAAGPGSWWFALGTGSMLFTGRITFALGVAIGLGALLALGSGRPRVATALAAACALASPVAALFLVLAGAAVALVGAGPGAAGGPPLRRGAGVAVAAGALGPPVAFAVAFPEGGTQPFLPGSLLTVLAFCALFTALLPPQERLLRAGAALYAAGAVAAFALPTPVGSNWARLGPLLGGPLLACALAGDRRPWAWSALAGRLAARRRERSADDPAAGSAGSERAPTRAAVALLAAGLAAFGAWQWSAAARDTAHAVADPAARAAYYAPLLRYLDGAASPADRVEVLFTASHWEAAEVAPRHPLARGWERQLDRGRHRLFYDGSLTAGTYGAWLRKNAVRFVAVPDARLDPSSEPERALVLRRRPGYLVPRWRSAHWRVYAVVPRPPAALPARGADIRVRDLSAADAVDLDVRRPGSAVVRVRFTPYWRLAGGCVERAGAWTRVTLRRPGPARLSIAVSADRLVERGRRCAP